MRVLVEPALGFGDVDRLEQRHGRAVRDLAALVEVQPQRLGDLLADRHHRIERAHRVLEDHGDVPAAELAHLGVGGRDEVLTEETDPTGAPDVLLRQQVHHRTGQDRLARAGLADETERGPAPEGEIDAVDGANRAPGREEVRAQILHLEDDLGDGCVDDGGVARLGRHRHHPQSDVVEPRLGSVGVTIGTRSRGATRRRAIRVGKLVVPSVMTRTIRLRRWQKVAFDAYVEADRTDFLAVATPGAGKTTFALAVARYELARRPARLIVVAPTAHLKTPVGGGRRAGGASPRPDVVTQRRAGRRPARHRHHVPTGRHLGAGVGRAGRGGRRDPRRDPPCRRRAGVG